MQCLGLGPQDDGDHGMEDEQERHGEAQERETVRKRKEITVQEEDTTKQTKGHRATLQ